MQGSEAGSTLEGRGRVGGEPLSTRHLQLSEERNVISSRHCSFFMKSQICRFDQFRVLDNLLTNVKLHFHEPAIRFYWSILWSIEWYHYPTLLSSRENKKKIPIFVWYFSINLLWWCFGKFCVINRPFKNAEFTFGQLWDVIKTKKSSTL